MLEQHEEDPGAMLAAGMNAIRRFLRTRGGAGDDSEVETESVVAYLTAIFHGHHPPGEVGLRSTRELRTIAESIDALNEGRLAAVGDILMQRFKALEVSVKDGNWQLAQQLELVASTDVGLAGTTELKDAAASSIQQGKLAELRGRPSGRRAQVP